MNRNPHTRWRVAVAIAAAVTATASAGAAGTRAAARAECPSSTDTAYTMQLRALTGPAGAELTLTVAAAPDCAVPTELKKLQLKTFAADGSLDETRNLTDVPSPGGIANVTLGSVPRDRRIEADALVQTGTPPRTYVVREATTTLLRPDLVIESITAPPQTLTTRPIDVTAVVRELNGDVGATAKVTLSPVAGSAFGTAEVTVLAGGRATVTFTGIALTAPQPTELVVRVDEASPAETDTANNARNVTVDVTEHELNRPRILFPSLVGYGAQFNNHLYAPITQPHVPPGEYQDVEQKVRELEPQLVRIFYNDNWEENIDGRHPEHSENYASFVHVVQLAQESGATIDISYQNLANAKSTPVTSMDNYADALEDLVRNHGLVNVRWAEVGNEPNSGAVTLDEYNRLYRELQAQLVARGLRDHIHLMGGGLVENAGNPARTHYVWMQWIAANMGDILDGYAEHVYWTYNDAGRLEYRLRDTDHLMNEVLPPEQRKPVYMMEFGIRGIRTCGTKTPFNNLYYAVDPACPEIWRTNIAAFQQFWFAVDSAQLGVAGASKWDAYWAVYDFNSVNQQVYWMTGPPSEGYPLTPTYHVMSMLFHVTVPGWQIVGVEPWDASDWGVPTYGVEGHASNDQPEKELAGYAGPNGELTIVGLDTRGRGLNTASADPPVAYSIGELPPNTTFRLALWNATGDGTNSVAGPVTTNAVGVARFEVPLHAAFALTTVPVA